MKVYTTTWVKCFIHPIIPNLEYCLNCILLIFIFLWFSLPSYVMEAYGCQSGYMDFSMFADE